MKERVLSHFFNDTFCKLYLYWLMMKGFLKTCLYNSVADTKYFYIVRCQIHVQHLSLINGLYLFSNKIVKTWYWPFSFKSVSLPVLSWVYLHTPRSHREWGHSAWGGQRPLANQWGLIPLCSLSCTPSVCLLLKWIKMWVFLLTLYQSKNW